MEIGFENSALETRQRRTERTQYKMQIPENYGYVVLAIAAMGIPNVVAVVRVIKARSKYGVKYPNLYAPEVLFYILLLSTGKGGEFCHHVALMCLCGIQSLSLSLFPVRRFAHHLYHHQYHHHHLLLLLLLLLLFP